MRSRLSPETLALLYVLAGVMVMIAAAWAFGAIAEDVINHDAFLGGVDERVAHWLHAHATPLLTSIMMVISFLGAPPVSLAVGVVAAFALWQRRQYYALLALVLAVPFGMLLNVIVKYSIERHRPTFIDPIVTLTTYSFPSGHALGSTLLYGALAAIVIATRQQMHRRMLAASAAIAFILLVAFSRIYLGVHYLSDVVAGVLGGIAWLVLCFLVVTTLRRRRMRRDVDRSVD